MKPVSEGWGWNDTNVDIDGWIIHKKGDSEDRDGWGISHHSTKKKQKTAMAVFDFDTLDCLVCIEPLSSQIIQCCNGHYVCQPCIAKISDKCPTCSEPIGQIRNLGLEKIIESLKVQCKFTHLGCEKMLQYKAKNVHEQNCPHRPHHCPLDGCSFHGLVKDFSLHFKELHQAQTVNFKYARWFSVPIESYDHYLLLKSEEDKLLIFHNKKQVRDGINALFVTVLQAASGASPHNYYIVAKHGSNKVQLESRAVPCSSFASTAMAHASIDLLIPTISIASLTVELLCLDLLGSTSFLINVDKPQTIQHVWMIWDKKVNVARLNHLSIFMVLRIKVGACIYPLSIGRPWI